ncbi:MAG: hypothetical protein ACLFVP_05655 [Candidatus Bathyarchaeia archaeon]
MPIELRIETDFGNIVVSGEDRAEVLELVESLDELFMEEVNQRVSALIARQARNKLSGLVRMTDSGPVITTMHEMTHYEAVGLILYSLKDNQASSRDVIERLNASGKKVSVHARIHEMRKRGHVFKPGKAPVYKLSSDGVRWMEEEVIPKLKEDD